MAAGQVQYFAGQIRYASLDVTRRLESDRQTRRLSSLASHIDVKREKSISSEDSTEGALLPTVKGDTRGGCTRRKN